MNKDLLCKQPTTYIQLSSGIDTDLSIVTGLLWRIHQAELIE